MRAAISAHPAAVIASLHDQAVAAVLAPKIRQTLEAKGASPVGSTPEQLAAHVQGELARWAPVVKASGIQVN